MILSMWQMLAIYSYATKLCICWVRIQINYVHNDFLNEDLIWYFGGLYQIFDVLVNCKYKEQKAQQMVNILISGYKET